MAGRNSEDKIRCSFCGKSQDQVRKLIAGPNGAYICDECVDICAEIIEEEFEEEEKLDYDLIIFFSPLGVSSLIKNFPNFVDNHIAVGCFGKSTAKTLKDLGITVDIEAPTPEIPSMTAALDQFLTENHK